MPAQLRDLLLGLLDLLHERADAAVLALLLILSGTLLVFLGATLKFGCAHLLLLESRLGSFLRRSEALIDLPQRLVNNKIVELVFNARCTAERPILMRSIFEYSYLWALRAPTVVELLEVLQ